MSNTNGSSGSGLLDSNGSDVKVNNMERFKSDNVELKLWVDKAIEYVTDIVKGAGSAHIELNDIDSKLNGLQVVTLNTKWKITFYDTSVDTFANRLIDTAADSLGNCYSGFKYAELLIEAYNNGGKLPPELEKEKDAYKDYLVGRIVNTSPWLLTSTFEIFAEKIPLFASFYLLSKAFTYAKDGAVDGGDFVVGDGVKKIVDTIFQQAGSSLTNIIPAESFSRLLEASTKIGSGTCAVALFEALIGAQIRASNDEGDYTELDEERNLLRGAGAVLSFASWAVISELCVAAGMSTGGAGVVAALASIPVGMIIDSVIDGITGDKIVDRFSVDKNGNIIEGDYYSIPANGNGENGTYDVILSRFKNNYEQNRTGNYDDVYLDWYSYGNYYNGERMNLTKDEIIIFDDALDCVRNANTEQEAAMIWDKITHYEMNVNSTYSDSVQHDSIKHVVNYLNTLDQNDTKRLFTFDIKEWWKANKK